MKICYMSDLHLEFGYMHQEKMPKGDILILPGDIGVYNPYDGATNEYVNEWMYNQDFDHIIYVAGNHEAYGYKFDDVMYQLNEKFDGDTKIHFLDNDAVTIDGIKFVGTTMWTDFDNEDPVTTGQAQRMMNDFQLIRGFTTQRAVVEYKRALKFLKEEVDEGCVVITHHAPTFKVYDKSYLKGDDLNGAYATELDDFIIDKKPAYWIHGHLHNTTKLQVGETQVLCNPRGYMGVEENRNFDFDAAFYIDERY